MIFYTEVKIQDYRRVMLAILTLQPIFSRIGPETKGRLIMRIKLFLLFTTVAIVQVSAHDLFAQKATLDETNSPLEKIIEKLRDQSGYDFFYNNALLKKAKRVTIKVTDAPLEEVLEKCFAGQPFTYVVLDNAVIIREVKNPTKDPAGSAPKKTNQQAVAGKVSDASAPLSGVSVRIKGTNRGTSTDTDGSYSLTNVLPDAVLVFSLMGMKTQEVPVDHRTVINVTLQEETLEMEEMVVVGYGTQKKVNLTGSVSSVIMNQVAKKTVSQTSQLLAGEISGLTVTQGSGNPGGNLAELNVRGPGTFSDAGNSPLVLVDGIASSINSVNPNDIASISVLKDAASAAIYGSRGANGVILITTKTGKQGRMQVQYDSYIGKQTPMELPHYVDSWVYAEAWNEANRNVGAGPRFSQAEIEKFKSGEDPDNYPNSHHVKDLFHTGSGFQTKHNLTASGGSEGIRYLVSTGYLRQDGLIAKNYYDRYDIRANINANLSDRLRLNAILRGTYSLLREPARVGLTGTGDMDALIASAFSRNATVPKRRSDGTYGTWMGHPGPWEALDGESFYQHRIGSFANNASLEWDALKSLKITGRIGYNQEYSQERLFGAETASSPDLVFGPSTGEVNMGTSRYLIMDAFANYDKTFGTHHVQIMGGYSQEIYNDDLLGAFRDHFPTNTIYVLDAASPENDSNWDTQSTWKLRSYFGRVNYAFKDRYLLEGNLRFDGSSRFAKGKRYGLFPSLSAGWIISDEPFFNVPWITTLKLRGSYGVLGNQQIGTYPYQRALSPDHRYFVGGVVQPAIALDELPFEDITWETTEITNGGVDVVLVDGKLSLSVDHYYKKTYDILYSLTVSSVLGMATGDQNAGAVGNRGWDFDLSYRNTVGSFSYSISPKFSIVRNRVLSLANVERDIAQGLFVGEPLFSHYGYETEGLFVDEQDIANYAVQNYPAKPGYIRYKDISGPGGTPDGRITSQYDRKVLGSRFPRYSYGMGITADYKGFDLYLQFQGLGGNKKITSGKRLPFYNQGNVEQWHMDERWTEENPDRNAKFPRLEETFQRPPYDVDVLQYWLLDASFLRVKNLQLGYNFPGLKSDRISQMRIYLSGENLYTFDHYRPGWDPELETSVGSNLWVNPLTKVWSLGIHANF